MKVSIITVCFNSGKTIEDTIKSVIEQTYKSIEYIVIDGGSTDDTNEIISKYSDVVNVYISEKDNGLYDAMNKGLKIATGELVGILNSDDILAYRSAIEDIVNNVAGYDGIYADIGFYNHDFSKKTRHFSSANFRKEKFSRGFMPAHPSCYFKKELIDVVGLYDTTYRIASDFDYLLRSFKVCNSHFFYLNKEVVKMREGGISTSGIISKLILNKEIIDSCAKNGISSGWIYILSKYPEKLAGLINKKVQ